MRFLKASFAGELERTRHVLITELKSRLSDTQKRSILDFKKGEMDWLDFTFPHAADLPGVQWKQRNLERMNKAKRHLAIERLESILYG